ncbi:TcpQ domain-containing protein [Citrobacter meridianamericanus]|uniref:TcpQ domain-containing protein n=1 Tax=Citrobacter meridianamericanus TaxID=2894201 RepID=UPI00351D7D35
MSFHAQAAEPTNGIKQGRSPFQVDNIAKPGNTGTIAPPAMKAAPVNTGAVSSLVMKTTPGTYTPSPVYLTLNQNMLLSQEIQKWAVSNGLKPLWNSNRDYMIYNTISISGKTIDDTLTQLGQIFSSEHYGLVIKLYEKNNVLVIDAQ